MRIAASFCLLAVVAGCAARQAAEAVNHTAPVIDELNAPPDVPRAWGRIEATSGNGWAAVELFSRMCSPSPDRQYSPNDTHIVAKNDSPVATELWVGRAVFVRHDHNTGRWHILYPAESVRSVEDNYAPRIISHVYPFSPEDNSKPIERKPEPVNQNWPAPAPTPEDLPPVNDPNPRTLERPPVTPPPPSIKAIPIGFTPPAAFWFGLATFEGEQPGTGRVLMLDNASGRLMLIGVLPVVNKNGEAVGVGTRIESITRLPEDRREPEPVAPLPPAPIAPEKKDRDL